MEKTALSDGFVIEFVIEFWGVFQEVLTTFVTG